MNTLKTFHLNIDVVYGEDKESYLYSDFPISQPTHLLYFEEHNEIERKKKKYFFFSKKKKKNINIINFN
jgi:hypothetical protein